jgi:hypothetical protein
LRAIQHNAADGTYKQIWSEVCGTNYTTMKTFYPLKDLEESHDKVLEIVAEATEKPADTALSAVTARATACHQALVTQATDRRGHGVRFRTA